MGVRGEASTMPGQRAENPDTDTGPTTGTLSLMEIRRGLLREASSLTVRAEVLRKRGQRTLACRLRRRALQLWTSAQRIEVPNAEK
jgi:hypothetical protein